MKSKYALLLASLSCLSTPAFAANSSDAFDVEIGGYFKGYGNFVDQESRNDDVKDFDFLRRSEVHVDAARQFSDNFKLGIHIEGLSDSGSNFDIDESLIYAQGSWGQINFGGKDGAAYLLQVAAPSADKDIDGVRQQISPVNTAALGDIGELDYDQNISSKSDKITYFTPKYNGLQFGVSYTPEVGDSRGGNGNAADDNGTNATSDVYDLAVRYETKLQDVKVIAGAGYTTASRETGAGNNDREAWNVAMTLGYNNVTLGAAYHMDDEAALNNEDVEYLAIGVDYKMDRFLFGASYYNKDDNVGAKFDTDRYTAGVNYNYAPGMQLRGSLSYLESHQDGGTTVDATSFTLGTAIDF